MSPEFDPNRTRRGAGILTQELEDIHPLAPGADETCPALLAPWLFPKPSKDATNQTTFALLDGSRIPNLGLMLDGADLPYRCLYKGEAEEELGEMAPYLVELDQHAQFTRGLLTDDPNSQAPWHLWRLNACVFLRADLSLEDLWRHLRKFTRLRDQNDKWLLVRFWEPFVFWHGMKFGNGIYRQLLEPLSHALVCREQIALVGKIETSQPPSAKHLGEEERKGLMIIWSIGQLADFMQASMGPTLEQLAPTRLDIEAFCTQVLHWCRRFGVTRLQDVSRFCVAHAYLGFKFDADPRMPMDLETDALHQELGGDHGSTEVLMKRIRRDHARLLDLSRRCETALVDLSEGGKSQAIYAEILADRGEPAAAKAITQELNRFLFGHFFEENQLVKNSILKSELQMDHDDCIESLNSQVTKMLEKLK